jgi:hypothetical protein
MRPARGARLHAAPELDCSQSIGLDTFEAGIAFRDARATIDVTRVNDDECQSVTHPGFDLAPQAPRSVEIRASEQAVGRSIVILESRFIAWVAVVCPGLVEATITCGSMQ